MRINEADERGFTALMISAANREEERLLALIGAGAFLDAQNHDGDTALTLAIKKGADHIASILIEKGADVNLADYDCNTPLIFASLKDGAPNIAALLLAGGAGVNLKNCLGETALHKAAYYGLYEIAELLAANGADINGKDINGDTPLHKAVSYGWEDVGELLVAGGADPDIRNDRGETPLEKAVSGRWERMAAVLDPTGAAAEDIKRMDEEVRKNRRSLFISKAGEDIRAAAQSYYEFIQNLNKMP